MTQEEFEQSMERILAPIRAHAAAKEVKLDKDILKMIYHWWRNGRFPFPRINTDESMPYVSKLKDLWNEIKSLPENRPYGADEIQSLAYLFAKAGVDRERGWGYLQKTTLKRNYYYKSSDLEATRKTYDRMFNKVSIDTDFRDSFR